MNRYSFCMISGSIIAGILAFFVCENIYRLFNDTLPRPCVTLIYFTVMFFIIALLLFVLQSMIFSKSQFILNKKQLFISALGIMLGSIMFEFIYDLDINSQNDRVSSYIFIIDNSGSMSETDPDGMRYRAIEKLLEDKSDKFEYAIYSFANEVTLLRPMTPKSESMDININNSGQTFMGNALSNISDEIKSKKIKVGKKCVVILLSDGLAMDIDSYEQIDLLVAPFVEQKIIINTIGLQLDKNALELMNAIATKTGGTCIAAENISELEYAMLQAGQTNSSERNLLNYREGTNWNWLYSILRIIFVILLGIDIAMMKTVLCEKFIDTNSVIKGSIICSVIAGLFLEIAINVWGMNEGIVRLIMCILLSLTILKKDFASQKSTSELLAKELADC